MTGGVDSKIVLWRHEIDLFVFASCRKIAVVEFLLSKGLNPEVPDGTGVSTTARLLDAVRSGDSTLDKDILTRVVEAANMTIINNAVSLSI